MEHVKIIVYILESRIPPDEDTSFVTPPIESFPYQIGFKDEKIFPDLNMFLEQEAMRFINLPEIRKFLVNRTIRKYGGLFGIPRDMTNYKREPSMQEAFKDLVDTISYKALHKYAADNP
jgi:hypothetical protein